MGNCNCCNRFIKTIDVVVDGGEVVLVVPDHIFENYEQVCLCIAQRLPRTTAQETVYIQSGVGSTDRYQIRTTTGEEVYSYQLRCRKVYPLIAVVATPEFVVNPKCLSYSTDVLNVTPVPNVTPTTPET